MSRYGMVWFISVVSHGLQFLTGVFQTEKEGRHGIECPLTVSIQSSVGGFGHLTLRLLRVITPDLQGFVLVRSFSFCWFPKCNDWRIEKRITVWHTGEFWNHYHCIILSFLIMKIHMFCGCFYSIRLGEETVCPTESSGARGCEQ